MVRGLVSESAGSGVSFARLALDPVGWMSGVTVVVALATLWGWLPMDLGVLLLAGSAGVVSGIASWRRVHEVPELDVRVAAFCVGGDGSWDYDLRTGTVAYDERCSQMLGYEAGAIESHLGAWGKLVHPEDVGHARTALDAFVSGHADSYEVEVRLVGADGRWRRILDRAEVVQRDESGRPTRLIGVHRLLPDVVPAQPVPAPTLVSAKPAVQPPPVSAEPQAVSVLDAFESVLASSATTLCLDIQSGDHLGDAYVDAATLRRAIAALLGALAQQFPARTVVPVRPRASRDVRMIGFSLGLPDGSHITTDSTSLDAARALLRTCRGRMRVRADQLVVEPPVARALTGAVRHHG